MVSPHNYTGLDQSVKFRLGGCDLCGRNITDVSANTPIVDRSRSFPSRRIRTSEAAAGFPDPFQERTAPRSSISSNPAHHHPPTLSPRASLKATSFLPTRTVAEQAGEEEDDNFAEEAGEEEEDFRVPVFPALSRIASRPGGHVHFAPPQTDFGPRNWFKSMKEGASKLGGKMKQGFNNASQDVLCVGKCSTPGYVCVARDPGAKIPTDTVCRKRCDGKVMDGLKKVGKKAEPDDTAPATFWGELARWGVPVTGLDAEGAEAEKQFAKSFQQDSENNFQPAKLGDFCQLTEKPPKSPGKWKNDGVPEVLIL